MTESGIIFNAIIYIHVVTKEEKPWRRNDSEGIILDGDPELLKDLESRFTEDEDFRGLPNKVGRYQCRLQYFYDSGGSGPEAEAEWHYDVLSAVEMTDDKSVVWARLRELEDRHEKAQAKAEEDAERINKLEASHADAKAAAKGFLDWAKSLLQNQSLPAGFAIELADRLGPISGILRSPHGWSHYEISEFSDYEAESLRGDFRKLAEVAGMELEPQYTNSYQIAQHIVRRLKEQDRAGVPFAQEVLWLTCLNDKAAPEYVRKNLDRIREMCEELLDRGGAMRDPVQ